jgi:hypothetical protein
MFLYWVLSQFEDENILGFNWRMDLLNTSTHHSGLQLITALSLVCTLYKTLEQALSVLTLH